jgi:hypothetical protein
MSDDESGDEGRHERGIAARKLERRVRGITCTREYFEGSPVNNSELCEVDPDVTDAMVCDAETNFEQRLTDKFLAMRKTDLEHNRIPKELKLMVSFKRGCDITTEDGKCYVVHYLAWIKGVTEKTGGSHQAEYWMVPLGRVSEEDVLKISEDDEVGLDVDDERLTQYLGKYMECGAALESKDRFLPSSDFTAQDLTRLTKRGYKAVFLGDVETI